MHYFGLEQYKCIPLYIIQPRPNSVAWFKTLQCSCSVEHWQHYIVIELPVSVIIKCLPMMICSSLPCCTQVSVPWCGWVSFHSLTTLPSATGAKSHGAHPYTLAMNTTNSPCLHIKQIASLRATKLWLWPTNLVSTLFTTSTAIWLPGMQRCHLHNPYGWRLLAQSQPGTFLCSVSISCSQKTSLANPCVLEVPPKWQKKVQRP